MFLGIFFSVCFEHFSRLVCFLSLCCFCPLLLMEENLCKGEFFQVFVFLIVVEKKRLWAEMLHFHLQPKANFFF